MAYIADISKPSIVCNGTTASGESHALARLPQDVLLHCLVPLLEFKELAALMLVSKGLRVLISGTGWRAAALSRWELSSLPDSYWRWLESDHADGMLRRAMQVLTNNLTTGSYKDEAALTRTVRITESQPGAWWSHVCKHFDQMSGSMKTDIRWLLRSPPQSPEEQSRFDGVRKLLLALQMSYPTLSDLRVISVKAHVTRSHRRDEEDEVENVPDHISLDCSAFYEVSPRCIV
jgi:hypothetical protein